MPIVFKKKIYNKSQIILWQITEDIDFFEQNTILSDDEKNKIKKINSSKRLFEILAERYILQKIIKFDYPILYNTNGKPYFNNELNISISHSNKNVALFVSLSNIGIDIEKISEKPERVKNKFLTSNEISIKTNFNEQIKFTLFWSAKETIYKLFSDYHLEFARDIKIQRLTKKFLIIKIEYKNINTSQKVFFEVFRNFVLTWTKN